MTLNFFTGYSTSPYLRSHKNAKPKDPRFSNEIKSLGESLISGTDQTEIDDQSLPEVRSYLRWRREQVLKNYDYPTASQIERISNDLLMRSHISTFQSEQDIQLKDLRSRYEQNEGEIKDLQAQKTAFLEDWNARKSEAFHKHNSERDEDIAKSMEKYEKQIQSPSNRKYSTELITLRKQQLSLSKSQRYDEAQAVLLEVEALEAYENEVFKIEWLKKGMLEKEKLEEKYDKQLACLNEKFDLEIFTLTPKLKKKEDHLLFVQDNLKKQIKRLENSNKHAQQLQTQVSDFNDESQLARVISSTNRTTYTRASRRNGRSHSTVK